MTVSEELQQEREFIDALRACLGLAPLYRKRPQLPPYVELNPRDIYLTRESTCNACRGK